MVRKSIYEMSFVKIYGLLVQKAKRKNKTKEEVDTIIYWLTGYDEISLAQQLKRDVDYKTFIEEAPCFNPLASLIKGTVCNVRVEDIDDPLMQKIRYLDKLIDELARGKTMDKILRKECN